MSDNPFYGLGEQNDLLHITWDQCEPLTNEDGTPSEAAQKSLPLAALLKQKGLDYLDLEKVGFRLGQNDTLASAWPEGIKFRDLLTGRRWAHDESDFRSALKLLRKDPERERDVLILVEGETDAARMHRDLPYDIGVLPSANTWAESFQSTAENYDRVYVALDNDDAGNKYSERILAALGNTGVRWAPPEAGTDWCETETLPPLPTAPEAPPLYVWGSELFELSYPEIPSYFESTLLPMTGMLMLHGWKSSFKSWLTFDLMLALAEGGRWGEFETTLPGQKVAIIQFEIPPPFYVQRMQFLRDRMMNADHFKNVMHFSPMSLPHFVANDKKHLHTVREALLTNGVKAVLFDPIRQMVGTRSMNDEEAQQELVQFFRELNREGVAVVFTHHDSKGSAKTRGGSPLDATGAGVLVGAADTVVSVQLPKGEDLEQSRRRNLRFLIRNAEPVPPRGYELKDDSVIYRTTDWDGEADESAPVDDPAVDEPKL